MLYFWYLARWRSGNAAVCRTDIQGFDSPPRLIMAGKESFAQRFVEVNKVIDVGTVGAGIILGSSPVVFIGMIGYIIDDIAQNHLERKNG